MQSDILQVVDQPPHALHAPPCFVKVQAQQGSYRATYLPLSR